MTGRPRSRTAAVSALSCFNGRLDCTFEVLLVVLVAGQDLHELGAVGDEALDPGPVNSSGHESLAGVGSGRPRPRRRRRLREQARHRR
jgi:hypothetical protein